MNTNEFRHPKERLQNLSSRHKVSTTYFYSIFWGNIIVLCDERMLERLRWEHRVGVTINGAACVHVRTCDVPAGCGPAHHARVLGSKEALYGVCLDQGDHLSFI